MGNCSPFPPPLLTLGQVSHHPLLTRAHTCLNHPLINVFSHPSLRMPAGLCLVHSTELLITVVDACASK